MAGADRAPPRSRAARRSASRRSIAGGGRVIIRGSSRGSAPSAEAESLRPFTGRCRAASSLAHSSRWVWDSLLMSPLIDTRESANRQVLCHFCKGATRDGGADGALLDAPVVHKQSRYPIGRVVLETAGAVTGGTARLALWDAEASGPSVIAIVLAEPLGGTRPAVEGIASPLLAPPGAPSTRAHHTRQGGRAGVVRGRAGGRIRDSPGNRRVGGARPGCRSAAAGLDAGAAVDAGAPLLAGHAVAVARQSVVSGHHCRVAATSRGSRCGGTRFAPSVPHRDSVHSEDPHVQASCPTRLGCSRAWRAAIACPPSAVPPYHSLHHHLWPRPS